MSRLTNGRNDTVEMNHSPGQEQQPRKAPGNEFKVLTVDGNMMVHGEIQSVL